MEGTATAGTFHCKRCREVFQQSYKRSRHEKKCLQLVENKNTANQEQIFKKYGTKSSSKDENHFVISSQLEEHFLNGAKEHLSQTLSFSTNYTTDWEKLSKTCSSMSQMSETAKLLLQEKDIQLTEVKERMIKLEDKLKRSKEKYKAQLKEQKEKIENKDSELLKLKQRTDGQEVVELKVKLGEMRAMLTEKDKQLGEWKALADSLVKNNASFDEFKQKMENLSVVTSAAPSPQPSPAQSEYSHSDHEMEDQSAPMSEDHGKEPVALDENDQADQEMQVDQEKQTTTDVNAGNGAKTKCMFSLVPLKNRGNTCYMNAILQLLQIVTIIKTGKHLFNNDEGIELYQRLIALEDYCVKQDAFDVLLKIIQMKSELQTTFAISTTSMMSCNKCQSTHPVVRDDFNLNLPITTSLHASIAILKQAEQVPDYLCNNCLTNSCTKQLTDIKFSDFVLLRFNRFDNSLNKIASSVDLPYSWIINGTAITLVCYIVHVGKTLDLRGTDYSHFTAMVNSGNKGQWIEVDDDKVRLMSAQEENTKRQSAYFCLYVKDNLCLNISLSIPAPISVLSKSNCGAPKNAVVGPVGDGEGNEVYGTNATRSDLKKQRLQPTTNEYNLFDGPLEQPGLYRNRWKDLQREADNVYINPQSAQKQMNLVNLKRRAKSTSLDRAASREAKRDNGVPLTLEERRAEQEATIKEQFQSSKDVTLKTENWLKSLSQCQSNADFQKLGDPICDAIILPEVPLIFGTGEDRYSRMKVFLFDFKVPVQHVGQAVRDGCVFIQLVDSNNMFNAALLKNLKVALDDLSKKVRSALKKQNKKEECIEEEVDKIHVKQIDYTQDLIGFFMSLTSNIFDDLREFSKWLKMPYSTEYTQLRTSFQFEKKCLLGSGKLVTTNRLKIYNKLVHLWTSGQFKKWLNMNAHKIFNASQSFYFDKVLPGSDEGLSRIEHSLYFHSKQEQDDLLFDANYNFTNKLIDPVVDALNKMKNKFRYNVPFPTFIESYFRAASTRSVLISFEEDLWAIAYSYSERTYCFTGHLVNHTKHSGTMFDFIRKYVPEDTNLRVFFRGNVYDMVKKRSKLMQLPLQSLNESHSEQYNFKLPSHYKYSLSRDELDSIQVDCDDEELLQILGIEKQAPLNKREQKRLAKEKREDEGTLVEHLLEQRRDEFKRYYMYKAPSEKLCKFYPEDTRGRAYICAEHRSEQLIRRGKGKGQLYLL